MKLIAGRSRLDINELLLARLRQARRDIDNENSEKNRIILAIQALADFIDNFEEVQIESLGIPLHMIAAALEDADRGISSRLLQISKQSGRSPTSQVREAVHGCAVFLSQRLSKFTDMTIDEADARVAQWATKAGMKPLQLAGNKITGRLVRGWRERIQQDVGERGKDTQAYRLMLQEVHDPPSGSSAAEVEAEAREVLAKFTAKYHIERGQKPTNHRS